MDMTTETAAVLGAVMAVVIAVLRIIERLVDALVQKKTGKCKFPPCRTARSARLSSMGSHNSASRTFGSGTTTTTRSIRG